MARKPKRMPTFFKVLLGDFTEKLRLPPAFVKKFEKIMPKSPTLKSKDGKSFVVPVISNEDGCFFKRGWNKFVKAYDLEMGDFLVFNLVNEKTFQVVIYGKTGCEKELKVVSDLEKSSNSSRSSVSSEIEEIKNKKQSCVKEEIKIKKRGPGRSKKWDSPKLSSQLKKPQVSATEAGSKNIQRNTETKEKERAEQKNLPYKVANPFFKAAVRLERSNPTATIPVGFCRKHFEGDKVKSLTLQVADIKWPVKLIRYENWNVAKLSSGWPAFAMENSLQVGDDCIFELIKSDVFNVTIKRSVK